MRITTGERNVCIGYGVGPTTNEATDSFKLYIDTMGDSNGTGPNSLIYGDQDGSNQDLTLNADVVISTSTTIQPEHSKSKVVKLNSLDL